MFYLVFDKLIIREDPGMLALNTSSSQEKKKKKKANIKQDINFLLGIEQSYILDESHSSCTNKQLPKDKYSVTQTCWRWLSILFSLSFFSVF